MMDIKEKDHPLSLKVMRLTRPSLFTGISVTCDSRDLPGDILNQESKYDMAIPQPDTGIGQVLLLPQSFGNIYLGETFSCCICVHNSSPDIVFDASLKAVLQMSNQRVPLLDEEDSEVTPLSPDGLINKIIQHEVKEVGTHILVCAVHYKGPGGLEQSFRKFFKFQVLKPLDVKTKFYNAEDYVSEEVYLEAGIQNITSGPIFLEKVSLDPAPSYTVTPLNSIVGQDSSKVDSVFGPIGSVNPHDTRQYLFCLRPCPEAKNNPSSLKQTSNIGKLDIVWRTNMGDKGRLQTSQLQRMIWASQYGDLKVMVDKVPSVVRLEESFDVILSITNISEKELSLHLDFLSGGFSTEWHCVNSRFLKTLGIGKTATIDLSLMPLKLGLQTIAGIKLTDTFLKRSYMYENLAQVFVTNEIAEKRKAFFSEWLQQQA